MITPISSFTPSDEYTTLVISERNSKQIKNFNGEFAIIDGKWTELISISGNEVKVKGAFVGVSKFSLTTGKSFKISPTMSGVKTIKYGSEEIADFKHIDSMIEFGRVRPDMSGVMQVVDYIENSTDLDIEYNGTMLTPVKAEMMSKAVSGILDVKSALEIGHENSIADSRGVVIGVFENFEYNILGKSGKDLVIEMNSFSPSGFFGPGVKLLVGNAVSVIESVSLPTITLQDNIPDGGKCMVELIDNLVITSIVSSDTVKVRGYTGGLKMIVDVLATKGSMPEVVVDGVVRNVESVNGDEITFYSYNNIGVPVYGYSEISPIIGDSKIHIKYPTPKSLVYTGGKVAIDSTVDVADIDFVEYGSVVTNSVDVVGDVEVISFITGAEPGKYIPTFADSIDEQ